MLFKSGLVSFGLFYLKSRISDSKLIKKANNEISVWSEFLKWLRLLAPLHEQSNKPFLNLVYDLNEWKRHLLNSAYKNKLNRLTSNFLRNFFIRFYVWETDNFAIRQRKRIPWESSWIFCGFFWKFRICWVALGSTPVVFFILGGGSEVSLSISGPGSSFKLMMRQDFWRPPPTLSCLLHLFCFAEFWLNRKKNIICFIKENLLPKRIRRYLKEKNRKKTGQKTFEVLDIIHLKETLRRFWKSKKKIVWRISSILEGSLVFAEASLLNNFRWVTSNDVYIQKL